MSDNCEHGIPREFCTAVHAPKSDSDYRELLLGCGHSRAKKITPPGSSSGWRGLVTLDNNPDVKPDIVTDLDNTALRWGSRIKGDPWEMIFPNTFDEVHAYEVLEHLGSQGNFRAFFHVFSEIWRILKPGGFLCATVPSRFSESLWGDPGHRRAIVPMSLVYLDQEQYKIQLDRENPSPMSDYRNVYKADFQCIDAHDNEQHFYFILQAVKPSRIGK